MKTYKSLLLEFDVPGGDGTRPMTKMEIDVWSRKFIRLFKQIGVHFKMSMHFADERVTDDRNKKHISSMELTHVLENFIRKYHKQITDDIQRVMTGNFKRADGQKWKGIEGLIRSDSTGIAMVYAIREPKGHEMKFRLPAVFNITTIMRKAGFRPKDGTKLQVVESLGNEFEIDESRVFDVD